jgi:hypothetical protein
MAYGWLASVESNNVSEVPYPEPGISQETRASMYPETYSDKMGKVLNQLVEEMFAPAMPVLPIDWLENHDILLDELELMYDAHMTIGGQQNRFNASVLRAAINVIRAL